MVEGEGSKEEELVKTKIDDPCDNRKHHKKACILPVFHPPLVVSQLEPPGPCPAAQDEEGGGGQGQQGDGHWPQVRHL